MVTCIGCISKTLAFRMYISHISFSGTAYEGLTGSRPEPHYNLGDLGLVPSTARTEFERSRASSRKTIGKVMLRLRFFHAKSDKIYEIKCLNIPVVNIRRITARYHLNLLSSCIQYLFEKRNCKFQTLAVSFWT